MQDSSQTNEQTYVHFFAVGYVDVTCVFVVGASIVVQTLLLLLVVVSLLVLVV